MNYSDYIKLQKEKTCDPRRRKKWLNEEWDLKVFGFNKIFKKNLDYIGNKCLCIGARTGQEVQALLDLGKDATGIDIVKCEPLVIEGDFHNLSFEDSSFDFVFSNVVDHALYPDKFFSEANRVLKDKGFSLYHLQVEKPNDRYGVFDINNIDDDVLKYNPNSEVIKLSDIYYPEFNTFNKELVLQVNK
jgi:SAM-dependent methyltransferase